MERKVDVRANLFKLDPTEWKAASGEESIYRSLYGIMKSIMARWSTKCLDDPVAFSPLLLHHLGPYQASHLSHSLRYFLALPFFLLVYVLNSSRSDLHISIFISINPLIHNSSATQNAFPFRHPPPGLRSRQYFRLADPPSSPRQLGGKRTPICRY